MEDARQRLIRYDEHDLATLAVDLARRLAEELGVQDNGFGGSDDLRQRLLLMKMKMQNSGHKPFPQFSKVQAEAAAKRRNLLEILRNITSIFNGKSLGGTSALLTGALSEILLQEKLLSKHDLVDELTDRMRALQAREILIIIAGETNSGKSTFLNVLLGQNVLPTNVLHCTYVVCKIVYSHSYIIETLDYQGHCEEYHCEDCDAARSQLEKVVTCDNTKRRQQNSSFKEITLKMPAEILKSGITLVDTPGIGENEAMDGVTINFVREAQASAFMYIIKSDGAGGVQEDRLLAFLRAVKENYKHDRLEGTFDPQAAMFVCHRWDTINPSEAEKVRRNALIKLEMVWPGFQANQTFLFSSKKAKLHLDIDPDFITDSFNNLLKGLKQLIDRATHNAIKYQYCWIKTLLQPACLHLRSMISNCIDNKEDLDEHFRDVAEKQEHLMKTSHDLIPIFEEKITYQKAFLKLKVKEILSLNDLRFSDFDDYRALLSKCEEDKFLSSSENRRRFDHQIVTCLIKYCDDYILRDDILKPIEDCILQEIKEHLGLLEDQVKQIKTDMQGTEIRRSWSLSRLGSSMSRDSLTSSYGSAISSSSETDEAEEASIPDPVVLTQEVEIFLQKRKSGGKKKGIFAGGSKLGFKILGKLRSGGSSYSDPKQYLDNQIEKLAAAICSDDSMIDGFVSRYLQFSERCLKHAIKCIPRFIAVNTELMNKIREHREAFLKDKQLMKEVMEKLEPHRAQLQGYGFLYMEDVNADQINFICERRDSSVQLQPGLTVSMRPNDDSGFGGSGSTRARARGLWTHLLNARMNVDDNPISVTIKTYSFIMEPPKQYSEIAALRCLEHQNVASFFGMTRIDGTNAEEDEIKPAPVLPAFIFKGQLWAANVYRKMKLVNIQEFIPTFLIELWQGLDFIHMEHLVHLELNLDTVLVDSHSGTVKLCQQCKPREAQLPVDLSCMTKAAVCLSPSVLQGNIYQISDDIYAYGILLWELLYPKNLPYREQRNWTLKKFIEEVHPSKMLKPALEGLDASIPVKTILEGCLICTKGTIITMKDIFRFREDIYQDPAILALRNPRSKPLEKRSLSSQSSDSDDMMTRSMDESNLRTATADNTLRRKSEPQTNNVHWSQKPLIVTIHEEKPEKVDKAVQPKPPPRRNRRPERHSMTIAPDLRGLEIPAHHRKISLPNSFMSSNEKSQRFELVPPVPYAEDTQTGADDEKKGLKKKEKLSEKAPLQIRRRSTGIIPSVKVDPPSEQDTSFCYRDSIRNRRNSHNKTPLSTATIESSLKRFADMQIIDSRSPKTHSSPSKYANDNTSISDGPWSMHESLIKRCDLDSTDGSISHSENDYPIQSHSVPHRSPVTTTAGYVFGRKRPVKQPTRSDALRVSSTSQIQDTDHVKPLLEEQISQSRPDSCQKLTPADDHDYNDFELLQQGKTVAEIADDTLHTWVSQKKKNHAGILISKQPNPLASESSFSSRFSDAGNFTHEEIMSRPHEPLLSLTNCSGSSDNNSSSIQSTNGTKPSLSRNADNFAYQSSCPYLCDEYEHSSKRIASELSEFSSSEQCSISSLSTMLNSGASAFPTVEQRNVGDTDHDTGLIDLETDYLPHFDVNDLSF